MEAHPSVNGPDTGRNSGGRRKKKYSTVRKGIKQNQNKLMETNPFTEHQMSDETNKLDRVHSCTFSEKKFGLCFQIKTIAHEFRLAVF